MTTICQRNIHLVFKIRLLAMSDTVSRTTPKTYKLFKLIKKQKSLTTINSLFFHLFYFRYMLGYVYYNIT